MQSDYGRDNRSGGRNQYRKNFGGRDNRSGGNNNNRNNNNRNNNNRNNNKNFKKRY
ncbi:MAG: hypothetical protein JST34_06020 [Bacteroidetes bacterium]|nr:hypothetical protein [Bacteroidota bacterium]MCC6693839.1 hypothetical protein [Chitinophagaceae bacterium]